MWHLAHAFEPETFSEQLYNLEEWLQLAADLRLPINLDRLQELYLTALERQVGPRCPAWPQENCRDISAENLHRLLQIGQRIRVNVNAWLRHLQLQD